MSVVTVYSGSGNPKTVEFNGTKWSELQDVLTQNNVIYNSSSTKAVVGETENTLESGDAVVPTTNFTLFLLPQKVKSGSDEFEESFEESYEETYEESSNQLAPQQAVAPTITKGGALEILANVQKELYEVINKVSGVSQYIRTSQTDPLDERAKELMGKLFK